MNLDWSEEQEVLRDTVRKLCAEASPLDVVRALEDDPKGVPDALWKQMGELGLLGVLVPETFGGSEQTLLEAVIVFEELGRALAPSPAFESAVMSAGVLNAAGSDAQKEEWLPKIATGEAIVTPAWMEPQRGFGPDGVALAAKKSGKGFVLNGTKRFVTFASVASRLLVLARTGKKPENVSLFLVDPQSDGVSMRQLKSLASDTQYEVSFENVKVPGDALVGAANGGWGIWDTAMHDGIIVLAAQAMGGCERALEITVQYAKDRKQFDKPIGAFQAISHYLADAITQLDGGKTLVYEAATARAQGKDVRRLAPMAKLFACQTYRDATAMCQQVWGGVGFTIEYDIQLYFRRAKQLQLTWWDTRHLEELIATDVLDR
ncbi:MAG: acyl-CoA dehydrogenase family protein [Myxococcota bacterium]